MQFTRIQLNNFRQYFGKQEISFAAGEHNNVTLLNGPNGAGKTCLLIAMNWCLYGEGVENIGALVSKEAALEAEYGETVECEVRILFEHQSQQYWAIRKARERKEQLGEFVEEDGEEEQKYRNFKLVRLPQQDGDFTLLQSKNGNMDPVDDSMRLINSILPINARQYFLFDGEKIDNLTRPNHSEEIEEAIRNILQLPSIENAKQHLAIVLKEQVRESKRGASKDEKDLYDKISDCETEIDKIDSEIQENRDNLKATKDLYNKVDDDLRKAESVKDLITRREELELQQKADKQNKASWKKKLRDNLSSSYIIPAQKITQKCVSYLSEKKRKGEIPSLVQESFISDLLAKCECMCGNELSKGSDGREKVKEFLDKCNKYNSSAQLLSDMLSNLETIGTKSESVAENITTAIQEVSKIDQSLESIQKKLEDLHLKLKGREETDIVMLEKQRKKLLQDKEDISGEIGRLKTQKGIHKGEIEKLMKQIADLGKEKEAIKKFLAMRTLSEKSLEVLKEVFEKFASQKREEIEKKIKEVFKTLIWKNSQFPKVKLTKKYLLQVYDQWGSPAMEELSAGERQVLSLSFIAAMATVSGGDVPLMMDTPFGRISSEVRQNIVSEIPNITQQLILMVQDRELTGKEKEMLMERVGGEYDLIFENGCTRVEEV